MHGEPGQTFPTSIHKRIYLAQQGQSPTAICRLRSGWVFLGDDQRLPGYSLLLADPPADSLNALPAPERLVFLEDMAAIGDALLEVQQASIINYSILGNLDRALHAHIHPRYDREDPERRRDHPMKYDWLGLPSVPFDAERDRPLMERIAAALAKRVEVMRRS